MTMFDVRNVQAVVKRTTAAMAALEQELNAADAKLGDGDTGGMLARVITALDGVPVSSPNDVGALFSAYAKAAAMATGSSLGTLFATALMTFAKETKGKAGVELGELGALFGKARDAMMARGGAKLGDKTVLDALDAISHALIGVVDAHAAKEKASAAARAALEEFRDKPNRIGRARMFAEQTIGLDDPGMLAVARLCDALSAKADAE